MMKEINRGVEKMFRIGEFSKLSKVSIRMLRYYDEVGLLKPQCVQSETGYRLYSTEQIERLNRIIFLRDSGFNVSEIKNILAKWSPEKIKEALLEKKQQIQETIAAEEEKLGKVNTALKDLDEEKENLSCQVVIKSIPEYQVFSLREQVENYFCEGRLWEKLCEEGARRKLPVNENTFTFAIYHCQEDEAQGVDIEVCMECEEETFSKGPFQYRKVEGWKRAACVMVYGPFERINGVYQKVALWLEENSQYQMLGESRQISHRGPQNETDEAKYVTELQIVLGLK